MIKIEAFVREDKFEDVKEALAKIEVHGITVYQVMGCGIQKGYREVIRGNEVEINMLPKIKFEIIVSDEVWEKKTIKAIQSNKLQLLDVIPVIFYVKIKHLNI